MITGKQFNQNCWILKGSCKGLEEGLGLNHSYTLIPGYDGNNKRLMLENGHWIPTKDWCILMGEQYVRICPEHGLHYKSADWCPDELALYCIPMEELYRVLPINLRGIREEDFNIYQADSKQYATCLTGEFLHWIRFQAGVIPPVRTAAYHMLVAYPSYGIRQDWLDLKHSIPSLPDGPDNPVHMVKWQKDGPSRVTSLPCSGSSEYESHIIIPAPGYIPHPDSWDWVTIAGEEEGGRTYIVKQFTKK